MNKKNNKTYFDITELYGIRTMITVKASSAYNIYSNKKIKISPQNKLTSWDNFIKKLLIFDGVQFLNNEPYYDIRNDYINVHFRYSQQKGKAYAFAYHQYIGLCKEDSINLLLNFDIKTVGWAFPHEIGHTLDIPERTVM